jgi:hypothetical protein
MLLLRQQNWLVLGHSAIETRSGLGFQDEMTSRFGLKKPCRIESFRNQEVRQACEVLMWTWKLFRPKP